MFKRIARLLSFLGARRGVGLLGPPFLRTYNAESGLSGRVASTWERRKRRRRRRSRGNGMSKKLWRWKGGEEDHADGELPSSEAIKIDAAGLRELTHRLRQKGLLWFSSIQWISTGPLRFRILLRGGRVRDSIAVSGAASGLRQRANCFWTTKAAGGDVQRIAGGSADADGAGAKSILHAAYQFAGLDSWEHLSRANTEGSTARENERRKQQRNFAGARLHLLVKTIFSGFDFPDNSLSPTEKRQTASGGSWSGDIRIWLSGFDIALKMPQKLQPGAVGGRISYFAPVSCSSFSSWCSSCPRCGGNDLHR